MVDVDVGVEDGEDQLGGYAYGVGGSVEFVEEALVPGVHGVLEYFLQRGQQTFLSFPIVW